ncbi:MAG: hypothetical protein J6Y20_06080 [Lachnospiraceae bacterium]|nr:hypothetical protein [Lachnospiraceae bacterium]
MRDPDKVFERVKERAEQYELQRLRRNNRILNVVLVFVMVVIVGFSIAVYLQRPGRKETPADNTETTVTPTRGVTVTPTEPAQPTVTKSPTPTKRPDSDDDSSIVWAVLITSWIPEEARVQIQEMLDKKGLNCRIEFVEVNDPGKDYWDWLNKMKKKGTGPDILSAGVWEHGMIDAAAFEEAEMLPLNDYLETEEGKALWDSFAEVEWDKTELHGKYYTVPYRYFGSYELYMYVNDRYLEEFSASFDGTYESLRALCSADPDSPRVIATGNFTSYLLRAFMGYQNLFGASYNLKTQRVEVLTNQSETKELLQMIYLDYQNGLWNMMGDEESMELPEDTLVYITNEEAELPEGYTKVIWVPDPCSTIIGSAYGVSATSNQRELALKVLAACYSDPEIASLLCWKEEVDAERWTAKTAYMNSLTTRYTTGFFPDISTDQYDVLRKYSDELSDLCSKMSWEINGTFRVNTSYPEYLEYYFSNPQDYGDIFDVLNEQLATWFRNRE